MFKYIILYLTKESNLSGFDGLYKNKELVNATIVKVNTLEELYTMADKNAVIITDDEYFGEKNQNIRRPVVGVGMNYHGKCQFIIEDETSISCSFLDMVEARFNNRSLIIAEDEGILIREMSIEDLDALYQMYDTLANCPFVEPLYEREKEEAFTINYIKNMYGFFGYGLWLIFDKASGRLIGRAGIENRTIDNINVQELGYIIGKPWQRMHYGERAARMIMKYAAEELYIEKLYLCTDKDNKPSIALAEKLGFSVYAMDVNKMNIYVKKL